MYIPRCIIDECSPLCSKMYGFEYMSRYILHVHCIPIEQHEELVQNLQKMEIKKEKIRENTVHNLVSKMNEVPRTIHPNDINDSRLPSWYCYKTGVCVLEIRRRRFITRHFCTNYRRCRSFLPKSLHLPSQTVDLRPQIVVRWDAF